MRRKTKRTDIATDDPELRAMWEAGRSLKDILRHKGAPGSAAYSGWKTLGFVDPTPQPLGCPPFSGRGGETAEQRCYRRFPIHCHKPG